MKTTFLRAAFLLALVLICLLAALVTGALALLPRYAAPVFGEPSAALNPFQRSLYAARLLNTRAALTTPLNLSAQPRVFEIPSGQSVNAITARLEEEGFVRSADQLRTYLIYTGLDTSVQAGKYQLSPAMTPLEIAAALQDPTPSIVDFIILPGWRAEEIAAALPTSGLAVTPNQFLEVVYAPPVNLLPPALQTLPNLEGFLLPGLYELPRDSTAAELAAAFTARFVETVPPDVLEGFTAQNLSLYESVTLASIVQREAVVEEEQPIIASVFLNRLAVGMALESDPTVQYALGRDPLTGSWWKSPLALDDLQTDSRYNTYRQAGLPPGPIANPALPALRAVAYPAQTDYYFFRALCDGSGRHRFAVTFEEHLQNACP